MNEFEKTIEDIRATIISDADPSEIWLKELDERYRAVVADANDRLKRCDELLNSGHRAEAIQQAEVNPKLLDLIGILDFSEHSHWSEYLKEYGFNVAPMLDLSVAEQLNAAYNEEASDDELMRRHRLHALRRSPLRARLAVIRQLAERQNGNPIWQEDIPAYEESRHRQILQEAKDIDKGVEEFEKLSLKARRIWEAALETAAGNVGSKKDYAQEIAAAASVANAAKASALKTIDAAVDSLALLENEVRSDIWRRRPPETTAQKVIELHTHLRSKKAKYRMEQIGEELVAAHNEWDAESGRTLREKWKVQAKIAQISTNHPLWKHVEPALNWLQQQDESDEAEGKYQEAIAALESALDDRLSRAEIEKRRYKLDNMDRDVPRALEIRIDERLEALEVAARRRSRLIFSSSVTSIILCGVGIGFVIYKQSRDDLKSQYVSALSEHVQNGEFENAERLLDKLAEEDPAIRESIEIQELVQDMNAREASEKQRVRDFETLVKEARAEGQDWQMRGNALAKLNRADGMAVGVQEKNEVQTVRDEVNKIYSRELKIIESQLRTEFEDLFEKFLAIQKSDRKNLDSISMLETQLKVFKNKPFVPNDVDENVTSLMLSLSALRSFENDEEEHNKKVGELWASSSSRSSFETQVKQYASQYLNERPLAAELQRLVKDESVIWDGLEQRNIFAQKWSGLAYQKFTPQQAQQYVDDSRTLFEQYSDLPGVPQAIEMAKALVPIANRNENDGRPRYDSLRELIDENSNLNVAIVLEEERVYRYYFDRKERPKPTVVGQRLKIYAYTDDLFSETKKVFFQPESLIPIDPGRKSYVSPMSRYMGQLEDNLNKKEMLWEQRFYEMVSSLESEVSMEPIRKVRLLAEILEIGCKGSMPFETVYGKDLQLIRSSRLNYRSPRWVDSKDKEIRDDRQSAVNLLHNLGFRTLEGTLARSSLAQSMVPSKKLEMLKTEMEKLGPVDMVSSYSWCSCLLNDEQAGWELASKLESSIGDVDLVTLHRVDGSVRLSKIGTFIDGKVQIEQDAGNALKSGRPVFAQRSL